jgi:hypothetical protein
MFGIPKFNIVIANPPYIKEYTDRNAFNGVRDRECYQGKMDIWYLFGCLGIDWLEKGGVECFIAQNNWITSYGASKFRNKVIKETRLVEFIDFGNYKIFESSGINTMIYLLEKTKDLERYNITYGRLKNKKINKTELKRFLRASGSDDKFQKFEMSFIRKKYVDRNITFFEPEIANVIHKISEGNKTTLRKNESTTGIDVHQDFVKDSHLNELNKKDIDVGDGIFVLSDSELRKLELTKKERELIKPYYTTEELSRYYGQSSHKYWIIYTESDIGERIDKFSNIKNHLNKFRNIITSDFAPYGLHRARDESFFIGENITSLRKCSIPRFTYTDFDCYVSQTFYVIKTNRFNMKYLTGILNSNVVAFWLWNKGKRQGNQYQIDKGPLSDIPLPIIGNGNNHLADKIERIVDLIISERKNDLDTDISGLEDRLNRNVYKLYGLFDKEVDIIENELILS